MFYQVIKEAIQDSFTFTGRSERLEHWVFLLFTAFCLLIVQIGAMTGIIMRVPINVIVLLFVVWLFIANVALMVRRLHDHDLSGFWLFLPLIPVFLMLIAARAIYGSGLSFMTADEGRILFKISQGGLVSALILFGSMFVRPGTKKSNRYGGPVD